MNTKLKLRDKQRALPSLLTLPLALLLLLSLVVGSSKGEAERECRYEDPITGEEFDLSGLARELRYSEGEEGEVFYVFVCGSTQPSYCSSIQTPTAVCQYPNPSSSPSSFYSCGQTSSQLFSSFSSPSTGEEGVTITYEGGSICSKLAGQPARRSIIHVLCSPSDGDIISVSEANCTYTFTISSKYGCANGVYVATSTPSPTYSPSPSPSPSAIPQPVINKYYDDDDNDGLLYAIIFLESIALFLTVIVLVGVGVIAGIMVRKHLRKATSDDFIF